MKKLLILFAIIFISSCEKIKESERDPEIQKFCWICEFDYPNFQGNGPHTIRKEVCDQTEDQIRSYEKNHSWKCDYPEIINSHCVTCWKKY